MTTTQTATQFFTAYPESWFGLTSTGKMHCYTTGGNSVESEPRNRGIVTTLCGRDMMPSRNRFDTRQQDSIVCSRCVVKARGISAAESREEREPTEFEGKGYRLTRGKFVAFSPDMVHVNVWKADQGGNVDPEGRDYRAEIVVSGIIQARGVASNRELAERRAWEAFQGRVERREHFEEGSA